MESMTSAMKDLITSKKYPERIHNSRNKNQKSSVKKSRLEILNKSFKLFVVEVKNLFSIYNFNLIFDGFRVSGCVDCHGESFGLSYILPMLSGVYMSEVKLLYLYHHACY